MGKSDDYIFIFDLDNTLVNTDALKLNLSNSNKFYDDPYKIIKNDKKLQILLDKIKNKKIIFSNALNCHVDKVCNSLGITKYFHHKCDRSITRTLKPNLNSYVKLLEINNIKKINRCIFFDDLIENLITAKYLGWITVHISKDEYKHCCIDYNFNNIHQALEYFINKNILNSG